MGETFIKAQGNVYMLRGLPAVLGLSDMSGKLPLSNPTASE
jgi:hypothetical protein